MTDDGNRKDGADPMALKQGDLGLLESEVARRLLASRIPARFAYVALDGTRRASAPSRASCAWRLQPTRRSDLPGSSALNSMRKR